MDIGKTWRLAKWSLRKLQLGIKPGDLVLEVGSGGNPHPRSDVLLDKHMAGAHRHGAQLVADRPMVLADACKMPFADKAFDFIIAFHVLEHVKDPAAFLHELMRVARAGYIETPNVLFERFIPYDVHVLEIMDLDDRLYIRKKTSPATDSFLHKLEIQERDAGWKRIVRGDPERFHVRHFWRDRINFEVVNPEDDCSWFDQASASLGDAGDVEPRGHVTPTWRSLGLAAWTHWHARRRHVDLDKLLACPDCHGSLTRTGKALCCARCDLSFEAEPVPNLDAPIVRADHAVVASAPLSLFSK